jgi:hypothetical protein
MLALFVVYKNRVRELKSSATPDKDYDCKASSGHPYDTNFSVVQI